MNAHRVPTTFVSFDGAVSATGLCMCQRPDRYRFIDAPDPDPAPRIARGGGYSYAAASFGAGSVVRDMRRFNRILRFDPATRIIEVESGVTLGDVFAVASREGLGLPVQPGYPAITVGGCIAANVHGKNPVREGTFVDSVLHLTLFHPARGVLRLSPDTAPGLFDLTCGGYGLTGVIVSATLRLEPLPGHVVSIRRFAVGRSRRGPPLGSRARGEEPLRVLLARWRSRQPHVRARLRLSGMPRARDAVAPRRRARVPCPHPGCEGPPAVLPLGRHGDPRLHLDLLAR